MDIGQSDVYFGSVGSVQLKKYNPAATNNCESINPNPSSNSEKVTPRGLSAADLLHSSTSKNNEQSANKWPWFRKKQTADQVCMDVSRQFVEEERESFRLVWRQLHFEVQSSAREQLMNKIARWAGMFRSKSGGYDESHLSDGDPASNSLGGAKKRIIFENLNGFASSGEMLAILGPSGAGKTSLVNAICGKTHNYRGSILLEGGGERRKRLSIIPQKDYLNERLTVRENLLYSSKLLNTGRDFDHEANILHVVKMLNLVGCLRSSAAKISGGEYKRVSIAQELLCQPDILILDEPTSGLDSLNCDNLIKSLKQLIEASRQGFIKPLAIIITIHQPDVELFHMFDHVYCMAQGGRVILDNHPRDTMRILREQSGISEDELVASSVGVVNPANLLIKIASGLHYGKDPIERLAKFQRSQFEEQNSGTKVCYGTKEGFEAGLASKLKQQLTEDELVSSGRNKQSVMNLLHRSSSDIMLTNSEIDPNYARPHKKEPPVRSKVHGECLMRDKRLNMKIDHRGKFWHHTLLLTSRAFVSTLRDPFMTAGSMLVHLLIPIVMWLVYDPQIGKVTTCPKIYREIDIVALAGGNTLDMIHDQVEQLIMAIECSTMFFISTYAFSMCTLAVAALAFPLNMHILLKEARNGWYSLPSYVLANSIASFPFEVLFPTLSLVMIYLMLDMPSSHLEWRLWAIALVMAVVSMISNTQGLIFGALFMHSAQSAIFLSLASTLPLILLSGFTSRVRQMPILLQRLTWLSMYRYSNECIAIIRFGFNMCPCDDSTADYLENEKASFVDVSPQMKSLFNYYLTGFTHELSPEDLPKHGALNNSLSHANMTSSHEADHVIPSVSWALTLNSTARADILKKIDAKEVDLFGSMANLVAGSFTYGLEVKDCRDVRAVRLMAGDVPADEYLPYLFLAMLGLLLAAKLILFIAVKLKIGRRI